MRNGFKGLLLFFLVFISASCIVAVYDPSGTENYRPFEEFQRLLPFPSAGILSLRNGSGRVEIYGWQYEECEVYAERKIPLSGESRLRFLLFNRYIPEIEIDSLEDHLNIQTVPAPAEDAPNEVDYFLQVPEAVILKDIVNTRGEIVIADLYGEAYVECGEGNVLIDNFSGSLHVHTGIGDIETRLFDLRSEDDIVLVTREGQITVELQSEVRASLDLFCPNGSISNEFSEESSVSAPSMSLKLNGGGARISVTAEKGNITVKKMMN